MPDERGTPSEAFISHSTLDDHFVSRFVEFLRENRIPFWYSPEHILAARQWHDEIGKALSRCDWFVLVLTPNAVESRWVKKELLYALNAPRYEDRIVPLLVRDCRFDQLSWTLDQIERVDFRASFDVGCRALLKTWESTGLRASNGFKEFMWLISDIERARVLDLGQASQPTLNFFIERGCRIATEDLLLSWKDFLATEKERLRQAPMGQGGEQISQAALADKFLETALKYPEETYHGVLAWDLFDYLDAELLPRVMERLYKLLTPGGSVLAQFHSRAPEKFYRYRPVDNQTIESLPAPTLTVHARVFHNREILDLFGQFQRSRTFVGPDQVREALFLK